MGALKRAAAELEKLDNAGLAHMCGLVAGDIREAADEDAPPSMLVKLLELCAARLKGTNGNAQREVHGASAVPDSD